MTISIVLALILALLSPFFYGFMNVLDKYGVSHKAKNAVSFGVIAQCVNFCVGIIIALLVSWKGITLHEIMFPVIAGILIGSQSFAYYIIMKNEDVSHMAGLLYVYPIIVAILSFIFLNEKISVISYIGMMLTLLGAVMLSVRLKKIKLKVSIWLFASFILVVALYEFMVKVAVTNIPQFNGIAINEIIASLTFAIVLFNKNIRNGVRFELGNIKWALLTETFTFLAMSTLYFAMSGLPATIVSSVAAIQPFPVLIFERIMQKRFGKMTRDTSLKHKLIPITLIVLGVILLYLPEILHLA